MLLPFMIPSSPADIHSGSPGHLVSVILIFPQSNAPSPVVVWCGSPGFPCLTKSRGRSQSSPEVYWSEPHCYPESDPLRREDSFVVCRGRRWDGMWLFVERMSPTTLLLCCVFKSRQRNWPVVWPYSLSQALKMELVVAAFLSRALTEFIS